MNIVEMYLTPNKWSRPGTKLKAKKGIVVHWVANPNTTATDNRNFFENRKYGKTGFGSAHEIIGLQGEVVICIPNDEYAYHVGSSMPWAKNTNQVYTPVAWERLNTNVKGTKPYPNNCTYGIEVCHVDWDGTMTAATLESLKVRVAHWCKEWGLDPVKDVYLHQEVVGWKDCHRWFLKKPSNPNLYWEPNEKWNEFKKSVKDYMRGEEPMTAEEKKAFDALVRRVEALERENIQLRARAAETMPDTWAVDAVKWAMENGISDGTRPKANITRQEVMAMLHRYHQKGGFTND